jgi:hypothetical protein
MIDNNFIISRSPQISEEIKEEILRNNWGFSSNYWIYLIIFLVICFIIFMVSIYFKKLRIFRLNKCIERGKYYLSLKNLDLAKEEYRKIKILAEKIKRKDINIRVLEFYKDLSKVIN